jgi:hypothetical protein
MSVKTLNINTDDVVKFTARLERMSENDLPRVIQKTLNEVAMDVKKKTMPASARRNFTVRSSNFFKANSRVDFAKRNKDISRIESTVGFTPRSGKSIDQAVDDLQEQEYGGKIEKKSFIPTKSARTSNNAKRNVKRNLRLSNKNSLKIRRAERETGKSEAHRFTKAVIKAGRGGFVMNDSGAVFKIKTLKRNRGQNWKWKLEFIYHYKKNRSVRVSKTRFMRTATEASAANLDTEFIKQAKKQIDFKLSR